MNKKISFVFVVIISLSLILIYTLASTYAVIINVKEENGVKEIIEVITLRDLVTDDNGNYNDVYYDVKRELNITDDEAKLILNSNKLNENLQIVLDSVVDYKLNGNINAKLSNDDIYNLILDGVINTFTLSDELKNKVINKSNVYKKDISDYVYDIDVNLIGDV